MYFDVKSCFQIVCVYIEALLPIIRGSFGSTVLPGFAATGSDGYKNSFNKTLWCVMVEKINSTILEVQGSFGLTYMVGIIPLNLRSQEMDKGVPRARAAAAAGQAGLGPDRAWRGVAGGK
jgi:hypothetical protein